MICSMKDVVEQFLGEELAIDYEGATEEQMKALELALNDLTSVRPHDDLSFSEHMMKYGPQNYTLLVYSSDSNNVSSYMRHVKNCRPEIIPISSVLEFVEGYHEVFSETDFDSVF